MRADSAAAPPRTSPAGGPHARLGLLQALLGSTDIEESARMALDWLGERTDVRQAFCAVVDAQRTCLVALAAYGIAPPRFEQYSVSLESGDDPLIRVLGGRTPAFFKAPRGNGAPERDFPTTPLGRTSFWAIPLGEEASTFDEPATGGLLLVASGTPQLASEVRWLIDVLGQKIDQLQGRGRLAEGEQRFRRERTLLHGIINAVTDPILLTDTEGRLVVANSRAEALFSPAEGQSEGRARAVELNNMLFSAALSRSAVEDQESAPRELLLVDPSDGSDLLFELLSTAVSNPREGTGIVSVLRNITDLRRATQQIGENYQKLREAEIEARAERDRLNIVIDSVADPILVTDPGGDISLMNAPAEKLFTTGDARSRAALRTVQANDAHFSSFVAGLLSSGQELQRRGEIALAEPSTGAGVPFEAIAAKIVSDVGELTAIVTILHDRTEAIEKADLYDQLKNASEQLEAKVQAATAELAQQNELLRRQAIELEQASALKSQFLANMSHEFRTPLNAILGYTSMLLQGVSGELTRGQRRNLDRVDSNGRHLLTIINEILDITRIEAGRMPLQISEFKVPDLVGEVMAELEGIAARSKLAVGTDLEADVPSIRSDRQKVKQIVLNLLSNALKFTHQGSITIRAWHEASARRVAIAVTDTGIGIPDADHEKIFEDFRQLDDAPTRQYSGTGLGLSICRRLAKMLGGAIDVESKLGHGSTFTARIPVRLRK